MWVSADRSNTSPSECFFALARAIASLQEVKLLPSDEELQQQYVGSSGLNNRKLQQLVNEQNKQCSTAIPTNFLAGSCGNDRHGNLQLAVMRTNRPLWMSRCSDYSRPAAGVASPPNVHDVYHPRLGSFEIADSVAVMYQGKIVEYGCVGQILPIPSIRIPKVC